MVTLALAAIAFVGSHFLLSHPLRRPIVVRIGEKSFLGIYSLVAFLTFGAMIWAYRSIGDQAPLWLADEALWIAAAILMFLASVFLAGSFVGNPALPGAPSVSRPRGVLAITRHPMMWSFAIWASVHFLLIATPKAAILDSSILILALAGAAMQDRKKRKLAGKNWHEWTAQTAFFPFGRGLASPGLAALIGGTILFLIATWAHPMPVGLWRWL